MATESVGIITEGGGNHHGELSSPLSQTSTHSNNWCWLLTRAAWYLKYTPQVPAHQSQPLSHLDKAGMLYTQTRLEALRVYTDYRV